MMHGTYNVKMLYLHLSSIPLFFILHILIPSPPLSSLSSLPVFLTYFLSLLFFFFSSGSFLPTLCLFSYQIFTYNVRVCTHKYTNTHTQNYSWMHVATSQFSPWLYSDALELQTYRHINAPPPQKKTCEQANETSQNIRGRIYNKCSKWQAAVNIKFGRTHRKKFERTEVWKSGWPLMSTTTKDPSNRTGLIEIHFHCTTKMERRSAVL